MKILRTFLKILWNLASLIIVITTMSCFLQWQDLKAVAEEKLSWARVNVVTCKPLTAPEAGCEEDPLSGASGSWPLLAIHPPLPSPAWTEAEERVTRDTRRGPGQTQGESPGRQAQEAGVHIKGVTSVGPDSPACPFVERGQIPWTAMSIFFN